MPNKTSAKWLGVLVIAALALLVTPAAAQTTPEATAQAAPSFPLAGTGQHTLGFQILQLDDAARDGRQLIVYVWYPAFAPDKPTDRQNALFSQDRAWFDAAPDLQAAPYPLILYSPYFGGTDHPEVEAPLASQGFVVAGPSSRPDEDMEDTFVDRPLDMLFILDRLAASNQTDFGGEIDTDHVGVMGTSLGAYTTLALSGARFDPSSASNWGTPGSQPFDVDPRDTWSDWNWDKLVAYRASLSSLTPLPSEGLWPPFTDSRIQADVMWSPCDIPLFGEDGLAAATVPSLIIGGTSDGICPYQPDDAYVFAHLGSPDRYLLTVVGADHIPGQGEPAVTQLYTAFFDVYLKGKQDEAQYLTADYVNNVEAQLKLGLMWGPYSGS